MEKKILYVGMDVHKKSIDVAITDKRTNGKVRSYGKIDGTLEALDKLVRKLKSNASDLHFVYEAGPCGYPIYRHLWVIIRIVFIFILVITSKHHLHFVFFMGL